MVKNRLVWLLFFLAVASLACYSDSKLWFSELTPAPPTITPLPTPLANQTLFQKDDLAWVPASLTEAAFRLDMTTIPEPLKPDLSNKSPQPCSQNTLVRVLYSAIHPTGTIYYLIDCNGVVGWTTEDRLLGPLTLTANTRALTTQEGVDPAVNAYKIEASDPPYRENDPFRQKLDCRVNDTVDVIAMYGLSTGELYYKIRCTNPINPVVPNIGWATPQGLFGPVRFRNGEVGLVPQSLTSIDLTSEPNGGEIVATCQAGERIQITSTPVQRLDDALFYELECSGGIGWANQNLLVGPIPYEVGERVLVTAPGVSNSAEVRQAVTATEAPAELEATASATEVVEATVLTEIPRVPLTVTPEVHTSENQVGECLDATITTVEALAGVEDELYAQVTCDDVMGWLNIKSLYGVVNYAVGETVPLGEAALIGFGQKGIYLSINLFDIEGSSGGSRVIAGDCAIDFTTLEPVEATLVDVGYYRTATGTVAGIFYRAQCLDADGQTIEGWINQDRIGEGS